MKKDEITTENIEIPKGVTLKVVDNVVTAVGPKGEASKKLVHKFVEVKVVSDNVEIVAKKSSQKELKVFYSFIAHVRNLIEGVTLGFVYKLKICSGHFPMNVTLKGNEFVVKNLFGAAVPRVLVLKHGAKVVINAQIIEVTGTNIEIVSQVSADIENLVRRVNYDRRVFQDGIYITEKNGKQI